MVDCNCSSRVIHTRTGEQQAQAVSLTPPFLSFSELNVGEISDNQTITVRNAGYSDLVLSSIQAVGAFSITYTAPMVLRPNESFVITVNFEPEYNGSTSGGIYIMFVDIAEAYFIQLLGTGIEQDSGDSALEAALAAGTANVGGETSGDIAIALDKSDIRLYSGNLVAKIQSALNAVGVATIPYGVWEHDGGTVGLGDNQHIILKGNIFNKTFAGEADLIQVVGKKNWSITGPAVYFGTRTIGTDAAEENFIKVDGGRAYQMYGMIAYQCKGRGFYFRDGATVGGVRGEQGQVSNIAAYGCDIGIETAAAASAEYICFNNVNTCNNRVGIKDGAGNSIFNGGNCSDNDELGFWLVGNYLNNAHGIVSSMNINHNGTYNLQCDNVTNGHTFANNHFYGNSLNSGTGAIFLNNSKGIVISGGHIDCWIYNFDGAGSGKNYIKGVYMPGGYGDVATLDAGGLRPKDLIILDCQGPGAYQAGVAISDPSEFYVAVQRNAASTQALTSGVLTDLVFNTVQANGDRRGAYNPITGITTVPADLAGQCTVTATLVFQGTALNAAASFAELILPSTGKRLITLSENGGVLLTGSVTTDVYLTAGQTINIKAAITGTSPVFGSAGYVCTLTITRKS